MERLDLIFQQTYTKRDLKDAQKYSRNIVININDKNNYHSALMKKLLENLFCKNSNYLVRRLLNNQG